MQEHEVRLPPEVPDCLLQRRVQPGWVQGVFRPVRPFEVAHLGGERELRQEIARRLRQGLMRAESQVVGARVERAYADVQRTGQETAFVTRPV